MTGYSKELKEIIDGLLKINFRIFSSNPIIKANMYLILKETSWLPKEAKFSERMYCLKNNILKNPGCEVCGKDVIFSPGGGFHYGRYCSRKCSRSKQFDNMSEEELLSRNKKQSKTQIKIQANMSQEAKKARSEKVSRIVTKWHVDMTSEVKKAIGEKISKIQADFSPEVKKAKSEKCFETMRKNGTLFIGTSEPANELCRNIYSQLDENLKEKTYTDELTGEFGKWDKIKKCYYKYDFVISNIKVCIEFNGDAWHPNPKMSEEQWNKWETIHPDKKMNRKLSADEFHKAYKDKINLIESVGFKVLQVWESDYKKNPIEVLNKCIEFIEEAKL